MRLPACLLTAALMAACNPLSVIEPPREQVMVDGFVIQLTTDAFRPEPIFVEHLGSSDPLRDAAHFSRHRAAVAFVTGCDLSAVTVEDDLETGLSIYLMPLAPCAPDAGMAATLS
ncbi:MAG: hypothetical protein AAFN09_01355 [Pseudomonadota bacterium]